MSIINKTQIQADALFRLSEKERRKKEKRLLQVEKFWSSFFKSSWGLKGQSPSSTVATVETPKTSEKVPLFASFSPR